MKNLMILMALVALGCGCMTSIKYPIQMPDGSIEFAEYRNPKLFRDNDFELIVLMPDGSKIEMRKVERSHAEDVVGIAVKAAIDAATKSAGGG